MVSFISLLSVIDDIYSFFALWWYNTRLGHYQYRLRLYGELRYVLVSRVLG
jgi:hypothetical protein